MKFEVTILGNSSATPVFNRNPTAQLLNCNEHFYLIDCGEGTQHQLIRFGYKAAKIDHIFISHLHGDHFFGLVGLLSSMHLYGRTKPLNIYGPQALQEILDVQFKYSETQIRYQINYHAISADKPQVILKNNDVEVETIILNHRIACTGFKFTEKKRLRKLLVEQLEAEEIPLEYYPMLKRGLNFDLPDGRHVEHLRYTKDSAVPKVYCYCSDTMYDERYFSSLTNADLVYHEATFLHEMLERAIETCHTTAKQAGEIANLVNAKRLLIGHFSSRYKVLDELLDEARSVFEKTDLALEGKTYQI